MSYRADKLVIDGHTTHTHAGNENTRRPKLASGKKEPKSKLNISAIIYLIMAISNLCHSLIHNSVYAYFSKPLTTDFAKADNWPKFQLAMSGGNLIWPLSLS